MLLSDHTILQRMKDDGAVVFEYEKAMKEEAAKQAEDGERPFCSQGEMNQAQKDIRGYFKKWGSSFATIFNYNKSEPVNDDFEVQCEGIGIPVEDRRELRKQVELAHPLYHDRRCLLSYIPSNALLPVAKMCCLSCFTINLLGGVVIIKKTNL